MSLEESLQKIDEIIQKLETEDITLEESFQSYQKGMALLKECNDSLDEVEKKVLKIAEDGKLDEF